VQVDCWVSEPGEIVLVGDEDRHVVIGGKTYELDATDFPLRIQVSEGAHKEEVLALLAKACSYLAEHWKIIASPPSLPTEPDLPEELP
jgi:hypothetical protein